MEFNFRKNRKETFWVETTYLSKGGRLTLLKSTLSSLPIYFFITVHYSSSCSSQIGEDTKEFPLGDF